MNRMCISECSPPQALVRRWTWLAPYGFLARGRMPANTKHRPARFRPTAKLKEIGNNYGGFRLKAKTLAVEMQQLRVRRTSQRGLVSRGRPMSEVIPFRKPPSKPKEDDETAEFLKLLERITKSIKKK
jgi:hypothetical protein